MVGCTRGDGVLARDVGGFRAGMFLSFVGKRAARSKEDWRKCWVTGGGSVAFADWQARRVRLTQQALAAAALWQGSLAVGSDRHVQRRWWAQGDAAADAFASGDWASLGGWWMQSGPLDKARCWWFRLEIHREELARWVPVRGALQDDIAFFECLAQVALAALRAKWTLGSGGRWLQGCDNQTSVGALRKKLSTKDPLAVAVQLMSSWESRHDIQVDVEYLPGDSNDAADQLSRWRKRGLSGFSENNECVLSLPMLFEGFAEASK